MDNYEEVITPRGGHKSMHSAHVLDERNESVRPSLSLKVCDPKGITKVEISMYNRVKFKVTGRSAEAVASRRLGLLQFKSMALLSNCYLLTTVLESETSFTYVAMDCIALGMGRLKTPMDSEQGNLIHNLHAGTMTLIFSTLGFAY